MTPNPVYRLYIALTLSKPLSERTYQIYNFFITFGDYLLVLNMARADCLLFTSSGRNFDMEEISESSFKFDKLR